LSKSFYKNSFFYKKYLGPVFIKRQQKQDNFVSSIFLIIKISFFLLAIISLIKLGYSSKVRLTRLRESEDSFLYVNYRCNFVTDKFDDLLSSAKIWKDEIIKNLSFPVQGDSHILSIIVGQEEKAIYLQKYLEENGFLAIAIRPPTVPVGQSRIRITIRRNLDFNLLKNFIAVLKEFK